MDSFLKHHGVQGQQWGIQHWPPYPIDTEKNVLKIKKGTHIKRLTLYDESIATGHAYVTYLKNDNEKYRGFFGNNLLIRGKGKPVYSVDMIAAKDLKAPSSEESFKEFVDLYKNDKEFAKRLGRYKKEQMRTATPRSTRYYEKKYSNLTDEQLKGEGYKIFVRSIGGDKYVRDKYFEALASKGYDYVIDKCDAGRFGIEPAIIFNREASTIYNGQEKVSKKEILSKFINKS